MQIQLKMLHNSRPDACTEESLDLIVFYWFLMQLLKVIVLLRAGLYSALLFASQVAEYQKESARTHENNTEKIFIFNTLTFWAQREYGIHYHSMFLNSVFKRISSEAGNWSL